MVEHVSIKHGVRVRPVPLRRIDPDTGASEIVDVPCGATTDDKCPPCAERQRSRRKAQCRQGWHADEEPILEPDEPSDRETELATPGPN